MFSGAIRSGTLVESGLMKEQQKSLSPRNSMAKWFLLLNESMNPPLLFSLLSQHGEVNNILTTSQQ